LPEFQYNFENDGNHYISPNGNVYFIVATHEINVATHSSSTLTFTDTTPPGGGGQNPGAPSNLAASDGTYADHVGLTWNAGDGAQRYELWRLAPQHDWAVLGTTTGTVYEDTAVTPGTIYYYKVRAARQGQGGVVYSDFSNVDSGYESQHGDTYSITVSIND